MTETLQNLNIEKSGFMEPQELAIHAIRSHVFVKRERNPDNEFPMPIVDFSNDLDNVSFRFPRGGKKDLSKTIEFTQENGRYKVMGRYNKQGATNNSLVDSRDQDFGEVDTFDPRKVREVLSTAYDTVLAWR